MAEHKIIASQTKEQAQANIDKLFEPKPKKAETQSMEERINTNAKNANATVAAAPPAESGDTLAELPIGLLDDFATGMSEQPFHPYREKEFEELKVSIERHGIIQPLIVRPNPRVEGRYEIIAGHNRRDAAKSVSYKTLPCIIRVLNDDQAILQMISTNLQQREKLLASEKAWAFRYRSEAWKRQGYRSDLWEDESSPQNGERLLTSMKIGMETGDSMNQVLRFIRLTYLVPELLQQVDDGMLGLMPGATLSYISADNQSALVKYAFVDRKLHISQALADALREADEKGTVFGEDTLPLLTQIAAERNKIGVSKKTLSKYFPTGTTRRSVNKTVEAALKQYFKSGGEIL